VCDTTPAIDRVRHKPRQHLDRMQPELWKLSVGESFRGATVARRLLGRRRAQSEERSLWGKDVRAIEIGQRGHCSFSLGVELRVMNMHAPQWDV
jgi:hypothetical protein